MKYDNDSGKHFMAALVAMAFIKVAKIAFFRKKNIICIPIATVPFIYKTKVFFIPVVKALICEIGMTFISMVKDGHIHRCLIEERLGDTRGMARNLSVSPRCAATITLTHHLDTRSSLDLDLQKSLVDSIITTLSAERVGDCTLGAEMSCRKSLIDSRITTLSAEGAGNEGWKSSSQKRNSLHIGKERRACTT